MQGEMDSFEPPAAGTRRVPDVAGVPAVLRASRRRRRVGIAVSTLIAFLWAVTIYLAWHGGLAALLFTHDWFVTTANPSIEASGATLNEVGVALVMANAYVVFFVLPLLLLLPVVLFLAARWKYPPRIVVFRPFNEAYDRRLTRILSKSVSRYGHVFTLADKHIATPWSVRVPLFLGQIGFAHFSVPMVRVAADIARLAQKLSRRGAVTVGWLLSFRKVFPIRTADAVWEECVKAILGDADIVLIDVSSRSVNVAREISFAREVGLGDRIAFLCRVEASALAASWLDEVRASSALGRPRIFTYGKALEDPASFERCLAGMALQADQTRRPARTGFAATLLPMAGLTVALALLTCVLDAPYVSPALTAAWSPFSLQLMHAYVYGGSREALDRLATRDLDGAIARLGAYTRDARADVRAMGMLGLGRLAEPSAVRVILDRELGKDDEKVVAEAVGRLVDRHGDAAVVATMNAMHDLRAPFRRRVQERLEGRTGGLSTEELVMRLDDRSEALRFFAALALPQSRDPRLIPVLLEMTDWLAPAEGWLGTPEPIFEYDAARRLEGFLAAADTPRLAATDLDPWLQRAEGRGAVLAIRLALKVDADDHLGKALARLGDKPVPAYMLALGSCGLDVPPRQAAILALAGTASLLATTATKTDCGKLSAARMLADQGRLEALRVALDANHVTVLLGGHHLDARAEAVLDALRRTLPRGQRLGLVEADFTNVSAVSYAALVRLASAVGDEESLRVAVIAYGDFGAWMFPSVAPVLASALPGKWYGWVVSLAASSAGERHARYAAVASSMSNRRALQAAGASMPGS